MPSHLATPATQDQEEEDDDGSYIEGEEDSPRGFVEEEDGDQ